MYALDIKILLTAAQCEIDGLCIYWQTRLTTKVKSGCVRDKYCNAPTVLLYNVGSSKFEPSNFLSDLETAIGDETGLVVSMLVSLSTL